jgi:hypothetical protein
MVEERRHTLERVGDVARAESRVHRECNLDASLSSEERGESVKVGVVTGFESVDNRQYLAAAEVK